MVSVHPIVDPLLWFHWVVGSLLVLGLPGWFWAGRYLRRLDWPTRLVSTFSVGLLLGPMDALASALSIPLDPWAHVIVLSLVGYGLGRSFTYRKIWERIEEDLPSLSFSEQIGISMICVAMAAVLLQGLASFSAPAHLHDASNHAFLIERIRDTASMSQGVVFGPPWRSFGVPYWLGWHVSAAHIADISGLPAYIVEWMMAVGATVFMPLAFSLLWRMVGFTVFTTILAGVFLVGNFYMPAGLFSWGGFGALLGFFLVPVSVALLRTSLRMDKSVLSAALLLGLVVSALIQIHAGELVIIIVMVLLSFVVWKKEEHIRPGRRAIIFGGGILVIAILMGPALWKTSHAYLSQAMDGPASASIAVVTVLGQALHFTGGEPVALRILVVVGLLWGLLHRRLRPFAITSILFLTLYTSLRVWHDLLSETLSSPFYRQPPRILHPQMLLIPPLMAAPFAALRSWGTAHGSWGRWFSAAILGTLLVWAVSPDATHNVLNLRNMRPASAFSDDDFQLALKIRDTVPPAARIANQPNDGSFWAQWISHRDFIDPTAWGVTPLRDAVSKLLERPWSHEVLRLRVQGVRYLYVSDGILPWVPPPPLSRAKVRKDPRFKEVLSGKDSSLFLIEWGNE